MPNHFVNKNGCRTHSFAYVFRQLYAKVAAVVAVIAFSGCQGKSEFPALETKATSGLTSIEQKWIVPKRLVVFTFHVPNVLLEDPKVEVLFPEGYFDTKHAGDHYPTVWMLHGGNSGPDFYNSTMLFDAKNNPIGVAKRPVIAVIPYAGVTGFYVNWFNFGSFGPPEWETFHIKMLLPWIEENFRTIRNRDQRWVLGGSMGGFGAVSYAARFPDLFSAVATISGELDHNNPLSWPLVGAAGIQPGASISAPPFSIWGLYQTDEIRWRGDNPVDLAINLDNTNILMCRGDGIPPLNPPPSPDALSSFATEASFITQENESFNSQLNNLGIAHQYFVMPGGSHVTPLCFPHVYDWLDSQLAMSHIATNLESFTYVSTRDQYAPFNWAVTVTRAALEFSALKVLDANHLEIIGSGLADLTTPSNYRPHSTHRIDIANSSGQHSDQLVVADNQGRLSITSITLGPANSNQQLSPGADIAGLPDSQDSQVLPFYTRGTGSRFYKATIQIEP